MQIYLATTEFGLGATAKRKTVAKKAAPAPTQPTDAQRIQQIRAQYPNYVFSGSRVRWAAEADRPLISAFRADTYFNYVAQAVSRFGYQDVRVWGKDFPGRLYVELTTHVDHSDISHIKANVEQAVRSQGFSINQDPRANSIGVVTEPQWIAKAGEAKNTALPADAPTVPTSKDDRGDGYDKYGRKVPKDDDGCGFLCGLGLSTPWLLAAGLFVGIIILKR